MLLKFWTYLGVIYYIGSSLFISNDLSNSNSGWVSNIGTSFFVLWKHSYQEDKVLRCVINKISLNLCVYKFVF